MKVKLALPDPAAVTFGIEVASAFLIGTMGALEAAVGTVVSASARIGTVTSVNDHVEAEPAEVTFGIENAVPKVGAVPFPPLFTWDAVVLPLTPFTEVVVLPTP